MKKAIKRTKKYYTLEEAAEFLGLSTGSVLNAIGRKDKRTGIPDLVGVRPALLLVGEDGKIYSGEDLSLSRDLITSESLKRFSEIRSHGTKKRARRGNRIRFYSKKGFLKKLGGKRERFFISEEMAAKAMKVTKGILRARIESGDEILPGIYVERAKAK